jgi:probable HAF family extracellular repeat protein
MTQPPLRRCLLAAGFSLCAASASAASASAASYKITTFAVPKAKQTNPVAINNSGTVVGYWVDSQYGVHGFVYSKDKVESLDPPGATATYLTGIATDGTIVGSFQDAKGSHGLIYAGGKFKVVDKAGSLYTAFNNINDKGVIVGTGTNAKEEVEAFTYANGKFTVIVNNGKAPTPVAINAGGEVAGYYEPPKETEHAFRYAHGKATTLPDPGDVFYTQSFAINKAGTEVGQAAKTDKTQYGFIYSEAGKMTIAGPPGSTDSFFIGINDSGTIVGATYNSKKIASGFVLAGGKYTTLNVTGKGVEETHALKINNAGEVMGDYVEKSGTKAFVAVPVKG